MGSRNREQTTAAAAPLLSSLVVRLTNNERSSDFEPAEVSRDPPPPSPSPGGYRVHARSVSPVRRRNDDHHFNSTFDHSDANPHRGWGRGRNFGRYHESQPHFSRGRGFDRSPGRGSAEHHRLPPGAFSSETTAKSNPNVEPREGDWFCANPACNNLNFARRDRCNKCHRPRHETKISPRRGHAGPPLPIRRFSGMGDSPRRAANDFRSPPFMARNYGIDLPTERDRREDRFAERHIRRDQPGYLDDGFDQRNRFERREPRVSYVSREITRDSLHNDRRGYQRRLPTPPFPSIRLPPPVAPRRWARDRSRSPIFLRDELPLKDYRQASYGEHGRNERHDPLPLSGLTQSPRVVSGRWARERSRSPLRNDLPLRSRSPLRNELPPLKDFYRGRNGHMNQGRDDRHGLARGRDAN